MPINSILKEFVTATILARLIIVVVFTIFLSDIQA